MAVLMLDRTLVGEQLAKLGVSPTEIDELTETVIYDDAVEVARIYHAGGLVALWNLETRSLRIYDRQAKLLFVGDVE
jgi:hypothetical protein